MWQKFYCKVQWIVGKLKKHFINSSPFTHFHQAVAYKFVCSRWNLPILHIKVCLQNLGSSTCENISIEPFVAPRRSVKCLWVRVWWGYKCENEFIPANILWKKREIFRGICKWPTLNKCPVISEAVPSIKSYKLFHYLIKINKKRAEL